MDGDMELRRDPPFQKMYRRGELDRCRRASFPFLESSQGLRFGYLFHRS